MTEVSSNPIVPGAVVVGVDGSESATRALDWAAEQASLEGRTLVVTHAVDDSAVQSSAWAGATWVLPTPFQQLMAMATEVVDAAVERATGHHPELDVVARPVHADVRRDLLALSHDASLLVLGSRGRGPVASAVLGSVSAHLARYSACPVVVCRPGHPGRVRDGVVVAVDGTAEGTPVIAHAFHHASLRRLPLTIIHCVDEVDDPEREQLLVASAVAGYGEQYPDVHVEVHLESGLLPAILDRGARAHDLVVVGRHPVESLGRRLGKPTATTVLEHTDSTVAVVPEPAP